MNIQRYHQIFLYENNHWWYQGRRKLLIEILRSKLTNKKTKILDFGCGPGSTIKILNHYGQTYGVDIEPKAIEYCKKKGIKNVKLIKPDENLPFDNNSFDVIACMDVLEHIKDTSSTLKDLYRVIKKDGLLIITVPAFSFLWGELDVLSHHYRRYTKKEIYNNLEKVGFKIEKATYFNFLFFFPIVLVRLFQKTTLGKRYNWGIKPVIKNNFINRLFTQIFCFDIKTDLRINMPFGISLLVIAKKY